MSFDSPVANNPGGSPAPSPKVDTMGGATGGAWGGSEYVGGGLFTDMIDSSKKMFVADKDIITWMCVGRGFLSVITLLFIILLMAYATGTLSLTSSNVMGIGAASIVFLSLSCLMDLIIAFEPKWLVSAPTTP